MSTCAVASSPAEGHVRVQPEPKMAPTIIPQLPPTVHITPGQTVPLSKTRHTDLARCLILTGSLQVGDVWRAFKARGTVLGHSLERGRRQLWPFVLLTKGWGCHRTSQDTVQDRLALRSPSERVTEQLKRDSGKKINCFLNGNEQIRSKK